jgi:hypothetical protein
MYVTHDSTKCAIREMEKTLKNKLKVATPVARNTNEAKMAFWYGLAESAFSGSMESGGRFCVGALSTILFQVP